jgi:2-oxoglutarate ferredoxin oxidoreductase subunit beta
LKEAFEHKGFAFIEIIQPCLIFHDDKGLKERTYMLEDHDYENYEAAMKKAEEFDYASKEYKQLKIPLGIFYRKESTTFEDNWPQLRDLKFKKTSWKDIKR